MLTAVVLTERTCRWVYLKFLNHLMALWIIRGGGGEGRGGMEHTGPHTHPTNQHLFKTYTVMTFSGDRKGTALFFCKDKMEQRWLCQTFFSQGLGWKVVDKPKIDTPLKPEPVCQDVPSSSPNKLASYSLGLVTILFAVLLSCMYWFRYKPRG